MIIGVLPPNPFDCSITANVSNIRCDGPGTFAFDVTANVINSGGWGFDIAGTNIAFAPNGSTVTVSGVATGNGTTQFNVFDHDKVDCSTTISVNDPAMVCNGTSSSTNGSCEAEIISSGNEILVTGLTNPNNGVRVVDGDFNILYECNTWDGSCTGQEAEYLLEEPGIYYVSVVTHTESWVPVCRLFERVVVEDNQGLAAPTNPGISIYPNPTEASTNLKLKNIDTNFIDVLVMNQIGRVEKSFKFRNTSDEVFNLELDGLKNGVYTVIVLSSENAPIAQRLVIGRDYQASGIRQ